MRCFGPGRPSPRSPLSENFGLAFGRLKSLAACLSCNQQLCANYNDAIKQQVTAGIIEPVLEDEASISAGVKHYLPHQPIIRPGHAIAKILAKIRIVYDAFAKPQHTNYCLCLLRGPCLLSSLCGILLRWMLCDVASVP